MKADVRGVEKIVLNSGLEETCYAALFLKLIEVVLFLVKVYVCYYLDYSSLLWLNESRRYKVLQVQFGKGLTLTVQIKWTVGNWMVLLTIVQYTANTVQYIQYAD